MPPKKKDEADSVYQERTKETKNLFDQLEEIDRIHVYQGNAHTRKKRVEQKQVDMMIAIDMLTHTFRGNMHQATLFTSDSDFIPLIDTLVQNGMFITLWYGETANCRTNKELKGAADARKRLNIHDIYHNFTPSFKKKFKLPSVEHRPKFENAILLQQWHDDEKGTIELMKIEQEFAVVFEENVPSSNFIHLRLHDLQQLKMYAQDLYGIQVPDSNN